MSRINLHCPECSTTLLVPKDAAGRRARCGGCQNRFVIPSAAELLEIEIAEMATAELGDRWNENEQPVTAAALAAAAEPPARRVPVLAGDTPSTGETILGIPSVVTEARPALRTDRPGPPSAPVPPRRHGSAPAQTDYPGDPTRPPARPYLVIREVNNHGIHCAFDARWLRDENFLTSMPVRCAFSGANASAKTDPLEARVLVAKNRTRDPATQPRSVEMHYEQKVDAKFDPRRLIREVARIEGLTEPFDRPLIYYAGGGHTNHAVECWGTRAADGSDVVEVRLPHAEVATAWIARVNGKTGPEYRRLKEDIAALDSSAWLALPQLTRQRIEAWCKLERGEQFKVFLREVDLTAADAGLGGVIVTDRRLLYRKYRQSRSLSLNQDATLHVITDDRAAHLTLESSGRLIKTGKIARTDVPQLIDALQDAPRLRVLVGKK